jgi:ABC-type sugar transport system substrate-binding protein
MQAAAALPYDKSVPSKRSFAAGAAALLCLLAVPAVAADRPAGYPAQPVRLVVRVPQAGMVATQQERARAAALQRFLLRELTPHSIRVTVIMPGSRASQAFDS